MTDSNAEFWAQKIDSGAFGSDHWLSIPFVHAWYNYLATGVPGSAFYIHWPRLLAPNGGKILSLGCGAGAMEFDIVRALPFRCVGVDLSSSLVENANQQAGSEGLSEQLKFVSGNLNTWEFAQNFDEPFDLVIFNMSLHHVEDIELCLSSARNALKPDGSLIVNEYVGPNHFKFEESTARVCRAIFSSLPDEVRRTVEDPTLRIDRLALPDFREVRRVDPSEAVRSSEIVEALEATFSIHTDRILPGTFLQFGLNRIAGNFAAEHHQPLIRWICELEFELMREGVLPVDCRLLVGSLK